MQAFFTVERKENGSWKQLKEVDYTQTNHTDLLPLIINHQKELCAKHGRWMDQRMLPESVHVPIIGHRANNAALTSELKSTISKQDIELGTANSLK